METIAGRIGGEQKATSDATQSAVHLLLAALNKNANNQESNSGLLGALQNDHDGSILDNILDFAKGTSNLNSRMTNGGGILKHVLGDKLGPAVEMITKTSGLNQDKSTSLLAMLAPIVMGAVGRNLRQAPQSNSNVLSDLLGAAINSESQNKKERSMLESLLDQDGDGSVMDDLLNIGMKFLRRN